MKTTNEGFLVNTLRRLPRHGVKALAAGAVLIAAALPLAVASVAGAATSISSATVVVNTALDGGNGSQNATANFGSGASGRITVSTITDANDGATNPVLTTNAPGVTFSNLTETGAPGAGTGFTVDFSSTSATVPGTYSLTLVDDGTGPSGSTDAAAFTVDAAPGYTASTLTGLADGVPVVAANDTITGSGFEYAGTNGSGNSAPTVVYTSAVNGTTLNVVSASITAGGGTLYTGTTIQAEVQPLNSVTSGPATPGAYSVTVNNGDGGTFTQANALTVTAAPVTNVDPSAFPAILASQAESITINGTGFQQGATVSFSGLNCYGAAGTNAISNAVAPATIWNSSTSLTTTFTQTNVATSGTPILCSVTVANPAPNAGNGATFTLSGGLGFAEASTVAPTITATSDTTAIVPGSPSTTVTFTGTGFSQFDTSALAKNPGTATEAAITLSNPSGNNGTTETYTVNVASGLAIGGPAGVTIEGSSIFPAGILVAGPVVTSQSPTDVPVGDAIGSVIVLTGTGFTPTITESGHFSNGGLVTQVSYVNATTVDLIVTVAPTTPDETGDTVTFSETDIAGVGASAAVSPAYSLVVGLAPSISAIVYSPSTATGVGLGATGQVVTIVGTNFKTGVVVGGFKNVNGVADAGVTAKVLAINTAGTQITASLAIAATDTNTLDYFTVTNTDGGYAASGPGVFLVIQAPPTVTSVSPATATANTTVAFTITGTGFVSGASVAATADGTCGAATVVSATSVTVSCTFGTATAAAALVVTNPNGGTATSATVLGAATPPAPPAPHATGEAGNGIVGRTVSIAVAGVGFYGQPKVTSTGSSVRAVVSKDNGTLMTVQVTVGQTTGPGEHTLTFTLANGKVFKVNYLIIK